MIGETDFFNPYFLKVIHLDYVGVPYIMESGVYLFNGQDFILRVYGEERELVNNIIEITEQVCVDFLIENGLIQGVKK